MVLKLFREEEGVKVRMPLKFRFQERSVYSSLIQILEKFLIHSSCFYPDTKIVTYLMLLPSVPQKLHDFMNVISKSYSKELHECKEFSLSNPKIII